MKDTFSSSVFAAVLAVMVALAPAPGTSSALNQYFVETFSTRQHKDAVHTTAVWDTIAGELRLPPFEMSVLSQAGITGDVHSVAVAGEYAFLANTFAGLQVVDISDPSDPTPVGSCDTPGIALGVAVAGDYAYVGDFSEGLQVIDISDPRNPVLVANCPTTHWADNVAVSGTYAYVAVTTSGIDVVDVSDPLAPFLAANLALPGTCVLVQVSGDHAYVGARGAGLQVVDVSIPTMPFIAGSYDTPGEVYGVSIDGDFAYLGDWGYGLHVLDITDPSNPSLLGSCDTPGEARGLAVDGDHVYLADGPAGLQMIDVSDPSDPTLVDTLSPVGYYEEVVVAGDLVYAADVPVGLQVVRVSHVVTFPSAAGKMPVECPTYGLDMAGDYVFVAADTAGLRVMDISNPEQPVLAGMRDTPGIAQGIAVSGNYAYVADGSGGLRIINVALPTWPTPAGGCLTEGHARSVVVDGDHAFVAMGDAGIRVVAVMYPLSPVPVGLFDTPGNAVDVAVSGNLLFVADGDSGLVVLDVSDPTTPTLLGTHPQQAFGIAVSGDRVCVAAGGSGLSVIDVSDPSMPGQVGGATTMGFARDVALVGNTLFVCEGVDGIHTYDFSDGWVLRWLGMGDTAGSADACVVAGDYAYVSDSGSGLQAVEVFQRAFDADRRSGQSLPVNGGPHDIVLARIASTQTDWIGWELSSDNGTHWQPFAANWMWGLLPSPGSALVWRSTHVYAGAGVNPSCDGVEIEWRYLFPVIESITDIRNDQGRRVRVTWTRSGNDFVGGSPQVVEYAIFRKIDDTLPLNDDSSDRANASGRTQTASAEDEPYLAYPPGDWDFVMTVPADAEDKYSAVVGTLADSTISDGMYYTTFFVRARTATSGVHFDSLPDSGYSVDNLAPNVPEGFAVAYNAAEGNELSWEPSQDADFRYFRIYRGTTPDFVPGHENLVHETVGTEWADPVGDDWMYLYKLTAVDFSGNESAPAAGEGATGIEVDGRVPERFAVYQNTPNPFNPATTIRYDVPRGGGRVRLDVFDVQGRLVRTLVDAVESEGAKTFVWDGSDAQGRKTASGVYFYRFAAPGYERTMKMVIVD